MSLRYKIKDENHKIFHLIIISKMFLFFFYIYIFIFVCYFKIHLFYSLFACLLNKIPSQFILYKNLKVQKEAAKIGNKATWNLFN